MDLTQASILLCFLMVALAHHGRKSYRQGREDAPDPEAECVEGQRGGGQRGGGGGGG